MRPRNLILAGITIVAIAATVLGVIAIATDDVGETVTLVAVAPLDGADDREGNVDLILVDGRPHLKIGWREPLTGPYQLWVDNVLIGTIVGPGRYRVDDAEVGDGVRLESDGDVVLSGVLIPAETAR